MKIFIICSVRGSTDEYKSKLEYYVQMLEKNKNEVHLPHRDTNQDASGIEICRQNKEAIMSADEVHIFYSSKSQGTHFDMGVAFALNKTIMVVENEKYGPGKSYARMLSEWERRKALD
jgi:nucleoside 2-deoxyribosyltransferase